MSAGVVNLQAQVESVLGALVKAATVELTKLFESRYRASAVDVAVDAGRAEDKSENEVVETLGGFPAADTKRSVGVQVDEGVFPPLVLSDGDCLRECEGEVTAVERCPILSEILRAEEIGRVDPQWSPPGEQVVAEPVDMVELSVLETEAPADSGTKTEVVLHVSAETWTETLGLGPAGAPPTKPRPLVIQPDTRDVASGEKVKFVCPLILKSEPLPPPKPDGSEKPAQAEPQPACVSTARGTAYSPSPSDGAVTPAQGGVWERIHMPKEAKNNLHMRLKLTSPTSPTCPDHKLLRPCAVQLVDILAPPGAEPGSEGEPGGRPRPRDLRRHQGVHTGHRLCCFRPSGDGVWRLQSVVAHSRDGYACGLCGKTFKRRKVLRRHERFHTGERPYACAACSKTFALRKSLRRHRRFHTGERPHACAQCGKSFRLRDNLKAHLRFHSGEKPFSCASCGKTFRIMRNLEKHRRNPCGFFVPSFRTIAGL